MARVYFSGCKIKAKYPEASERMAQLVRERGYAGEAAGCCRVNHKKLAESDVAVALCCNCMAMVDEDAANGRLDYLYALIDADDGFSLPDWGGVEMGLQDCGRAYDRPELHDAIRSLLAKMTVRVVELPDAREKSTYCGPFALAPAPKQDAGFAPMLLCTGGAEMLLSDMLTIVDKCEAAGVPVQLDAPEGMFHIYATYDGFMPEGTRAWKMVEDFVAERIG